MWGPTVAPAAAPVPPIDESYATALPAATLRSPVASEEAKSVPGASGPGQLLPCGWWFGCEQTSGHKATRAATRIPFERTRRFDGNHGFRRPPVRPPTFTSEATGSGSSILSKAVENNG